MREVLLRVLPLAEGPVVVLDDAGEQRGGPARASPLPCHGDLTAAASGPRTRSRGSTRGRSSISFASSTPARRASVRSASGKLTRSCGHEADDVAGDAAAEAVEEALLRRHHEGRRLLVVEGAEGEEMPALALELDAALSDDRGEVDRRLDGSIPSFVTCIQSPGTLGNLSSPFCGSPGFRGRSSEAGPRL